MALPFTKAFKELFSTNDINPAILSTPILEKKSQWAVDGFEAAAYTKDRSVIYNSTADTLINPSAGTRSEIVRLTRYLVNNYPVMERILSVSENYAIGNGLIANAATKDSDFNESNTALFDQWADSQFSSNDNSLNFYEAQKLIVRELVIAGEVFLVLVKTSSDYPQIQLVKTEDVKHSGNSDDKSLDGLYVDDYGKVTAYNIFSGKNFQVVDASNVIHLKRNKQIGQLRGIGAFPASLNTVRDVKDIEVLLKRAVKTHSALAVQVTRKSGETGDGISGGVLPVASPTPADPRIARGLENAFSGSVVTTQEGEDIKLLTSANPAANVMQFLDYLTRNICLNVGLPYEFAVNPEALNGTAMRFVLADGANYFANIQNILIDGALNRIYGWVTASFIKSGKVKPPADNAQYWHVSWTKPISITVDQQRVSNIEIALLQNSLLTFEAYYSARGKDWKQELRQKAAEEKMLNILAVEYGIDINRLRSLAAGTASIPTQTVDESKAA